MSVKSWIEELNETYERILSLGIYEATQEASQVVAEALSCLESIERKWTKKQE